MPKNCSTDVSLVIDYMDKILMGKNETAKTELKTQFGLEGLEHDDDFMGYAIFTYLWLIFANDYSSMLENGPWQWQGNSFYTNYSSFYQFCDAVEGVEAGAAVTPDANGVGLTKALAGYASWVKNIIPGCE